MEIVTIPHIVPIVRPIVLSVLLQQKRRTRAKVRQTEKSCLWFRWLIPLHSVLLFCGELWIYDTMLWMYHMLNQVVESIYHIDECRISIGGILKFDSKFLAICICSLQSTLSECRSWIWPKVLCLPHTIQYTDARCICIAVKSVRDWCEYACCV